MKFIKVVNSIANRLPFSEGVTLTFIRAVPSELRRSVILSCSNSVIMISGVGYTCGPPWTYPSPRVKRLVFGLIDNDSAMNELKVSNWLSKNNILASKVIDVCKLESNELELLDIYSDPYFLDGTSVVPSAFVSTITIPYFVKDTPCLKENWRAAFLNHFNCASLDNAFEYFGIRLANNIRAYQLLGAVNDCLTSDCITIAGELFEFDRFLMPEADFLVSGISISRMLRQKREFYLYLSVMLDAAEMAGVTTSISTIVNFASTNICNNSKQLCGFELELQKFLAN